MSLQQRQWQASDDGPDLLGGTPVFALPDDLTANTSYERAQREDVTASPVNEAEWVVTLSGGEGYHRVTWGLRGRTLVADCSCKGHQYHDFCAHVAAMWTVWVRGHLTVQHLDTGRRYDAPPAWLRLDTPDERDAYDALTAAELDAYLTCDCAGVGVREYARRSGRSPGTVGNLLGWAREKLGAEV